MSINNSQSNSLYIVKAIAIFSVIAAHFTFSNPSLLIVGKILGTIGMPVFMIIAGLFFDSDLSWEIIVSKKIQRLVIPWIIWSVITYLLHWISNRSSLSIVGLLAWAFGYKTWLYFVPVLLFCMVTFRILHYRGFLYISLGLTVVSCGLVIAGVFHSNEWLTNYQNPLNWIGFFGFGQLLRLKGFLQKSPRDLGYKRNQLVIVGLITVLLYVAYYWMVDKQFIDVSYWNYISIPFELCAAAFVYLFSCNVNRLTVLVEIGKKTYPIYFIHMQIGIGVFRAIDLLKVAKFGEKYIFIPFIVPIVIALICQVIIQVGIWLLNKIGLRKMIEYMGV